MINAAKGFFAGRPDEVPHDYFGPLLKRSGPDGYSARCSCGWRSRWTTADNATRLFRKHRSEKLDG